MQIGNIHFGKAETAVTPKISIMEAALLWDLLVGRYKCIRETRIYHSWAHDPDWRALLEFGINILGSQSRALEQQVKTFKLPLPDRPPLIDRLPENVSELHDRYAFAQVFEGCQSWIDYFARASRSMITNDPLRHIVVDCLTTDLTMFDKLVKFAKVKGWLEPIPMYTTN